METIFLCCLLTSMMANVAIYQYLKDRTFQKYSNPLDEYHVSTIEYHWILKLFLPVFTYWFSREKNKVLIATFSILDIPIVYIIYRDTVTGLYSYGTTRKLHHNFSYEDVKAKIKYLYDQNKLLKDKHLKALRLLEFYHPANFGGSGQILSHHVLNNTRNDA